MIDVVIPGLDDLLRDSSMINADFKFDLADYLAKSGNPPVRSLGEILDRGLYHTALEATFRARNAVEPIARATQSRRARIKRVAIRQAVEAVLREHRLAALAVSDAASKAGAHRRSHRARRTVSSARTRDCLRSDVPGRVHDDDLPVGIDLLGAAFKEQDLLSLGYAIEQTLKLRRPPFSTPLLVEGKAPAPRIATAAFSVQPRGRGASPDVLVNFSYDAITSRVSYTLKADQSNLDRLLGVWIHNGTVEKPGAARHQLLAAGGAPSGAVTLSSADRRDLAGGRLLARFYLKDSKGSAGDIQLTFGPEATTLQGTPLYQPSTLPNKQKLEADLEQARTQLAANLDDPEALIWVGRRYGYLWRFRESIEAFTSGVLRWPDNPKFYRHRGHRYITIRQFARAQADLETAATLVKGKPDEIEPDGAPNPAGKPRSTLQFNIWYHLGLARYLQGNYQGAYDAYVECMKVSTNDDSVTATTDWMWMTLMRLNRKADALALLDRITPKMDILENQSYHRRLLMYKGLEKPEALLDTAKADDTTIATQGYGVGNYYFVTGDRARARGVFERVVAGSGWNAFGYIAAEADLARWK